MTHPTHDRAAHDRAARWGDALSRLGQLAGVVVFAAVGAASVWAAASYEPSTLGASAITADGRLHGVPLLAVGAIELSAAIAFLDTDLAAPSSAILSVLALGAVVTLAALHAPVGGAALLLGSTLLVARATRGGRRVPLGGVLARLASGRSPSLRHPS
jgi:hypothetical protein